MADPQARELFGNLKSPRRHDRIQKAASVLKLVTDKIDPQSVAGSQLFGEDAFGQPTNHALDCLGQISKDFEYLFALMHEDEYKAFTPQDHVSVFLDLFILIRANPFFAIHQLQLMPSIAGAMSAFMAHKVSKASGGQLMTDKEAESEIYIRMVPLMVFLITGDINEQTNAEINIRTEMALVRD